MFDKVKRILLKYPNVYCIIIERNDFFGANYEAKH